MRILSNATAIQEKCKLVVNCIRNIYTKYDIEEVEEGLMRISQQNFNPKNHFFQEGQLSKDSTKTGLPEQSKETRQG